MAVAAGVSDLITAHRHEIAAEWVAELAQSIGRGGATKEAEFRAQCAEFLEVLAQAVRQAPVTDLDSHAYDPVRELLGRFSRQRGAQGFSPSETATFLFSLKKPLVARLRAANATNADALGQTLTAVNEFVDRLALHTVDVYQKGRDEIAVRQQQEMLELSTPVVKLWEGILALPMIGTLDSERTQIVMESLLQRIVETASEVAILDITGVPTVDTLVAQHLLKTVAAARLMGVECIISGIRPQIAQTIVHLGVDLGDVTTKATLADAFLVALKSRGLRVCEIASAG